MKNNKLQQLIEIYSREIADAGKKSDINLVQKKLGEFGQAVKLLEQDTVEKEIISYIKNNLVTKSWTDAQYWIGSVLEHPSPKYLEYFMEILKEEDPNAPHYWVLDAIEYMPENISELVIVSLKKLTEQINPAWTEEVIEKYFETIVWNDENAEDFIATLLNSSNEKIAFRAKYWMETFEVERKEDVEDD
ncbi:hypothetical protein [Brevibacillus laterosporus]|uniref:hypothetical protein n=1 Tax=Brevibacillus laterosporus TaxID=1465 RepID=UPI00197C9F7C|nr:hypothetical protein [Brevibacillus laterosporus]MED1786879.1 hypothetical protein [Brevibacillus laterosporus]WNX32317.1 hypothetical protein RWW94_05800 [Brevibacillus laterosporus]